MGKITCANVLSDLYSCGVTEVDKLSMMTSVCDNMTEEEQNIILPLIMKGFQDNAKSVGIPVQFLNPVINPWCIIGGIATSVCTKTEYISPLNAEVGDKLILTKPLGAQIACTTHRWFENPERREKLSKVVTEQQMKTAYKHATKSMARLNKTAAVLMHKYKGHAATDITGFGILGHAQNLAQYQINPVNFIIDTLPVIKNILPAAEIMGSKLKFLKGLTPETSGGLLISLSKDVAEDFCKDIEAAEGWRAWIIGTVTSGDKSSKLSDSLKIIEVDQFPTE